MLILVSCISWLLQEYAVKMQEPDQLPKLTQLREISFELVVPAGELRRQQHERRVCRLSHPSLQLTAAASACICLGGLQSYFYACNASAEGMQILRALRRLQGIFFRKYLHQLSKTFCAQQMMSVLYICAKSRPRDYMRGARCKPS